MRRLWHILCFSLLAMVCSNTSSAQILKDPTHWTYEAKKIAANEYELSFKLVLDEGWHIWAINVGGDGYQIVPTFTFQELQNVDWKGKIKESGTVINTVMEGVEGKVNYYSHTVTYTQIVKAAAGTIISGNHEYQVCNDNMCLPPKAVPFTFKLN